MKMYKYVHYAIKNLHYLDEDITAEDVEEYFVIHVVLNIHF